MSNVLKSGLAKRCIMVLSAALMVSVILFVFLSETFAICFSSPGYYGRWEDANQSKIEALQEYITDNEVTLEEVSSCSEWAKENLNLDINILEKSTAAFLGKNTSWHEVGIPVVCADGTAYVYDAHAKHKAQISAFSVAAGGFLLITIPYTYKTVQRIMVLNRKVDLLNEGELALPAESFGSDELAMLENGIENLRLSIMAQLDKKSNDLDYKSKMMTSLAHDIRTPLTRLTGYLDILRYKKFNSTEEFDKYITKAAQNAEELRLLTDTLFSNVCVSRSVTNVRLKDILTDSCSVLSESGFDVNSSISDEEVCVGIHELHLRRVFDNISSNIQKYANINKPVIISSFVTNENLNMNFTNYCGPCNCTDSNGIGLDTVRMLIEESGGEVYTYSSHDTFTLNIKIPVIKS